MVSIVIHIFKVLVQIHYSSLGLGAVSAVPRPFLFCPAVMAGLFYLPRAVLLTVCTGLFYFRHFSKKPLFSKFLKKPLFTVYEGSESAIFWKTQEFLFLTTFWLRKGTTLISCSFNTATFFQHLFTKLELRFLRSMWNAKMTTPRLSAPLASQIWQTLNIQSLPTFPTLHNRVSHIKHRCTYEGHISRPQKLPLHIWGSHISHPIPSLHIWSSHTS